MARGSNFGDFQKKNKRDRSKFKVKPIEGVFGGAAPDSLYSSDVQSAWARWRRGMELATAHGLDNSFSMAFRYIVPTVPGVAPGGALNGTLVGYPTPNKEMGMHWAGSTTAGTLRFDQLPPSGTLTVSGELPPGELFNGKVQNNDQFWYVRLTSTGVWSSTNTLPPPLYVEINIPFQPQVVLKPINGFVLTDRILASGGAPISNVTATGINTYTEAVLVDVDGHTGALQLKKNGSVRATEAGTLVTPARVPVPFEAGRFLMNGSTYCCSCQDYTQREYYYVSTMMGLRKGKLFPYSSPATLKPGRYEMIKQAVAGTTIFNEPLDLDVQSEYDPAISGIPERNMMIVTPSGTVSGDRYEVTGMVNQYVGYPAGNRDFPGVMRDFGRRYMTQYGDNPNSVSPTYPQMKDYDSVPGTNGKPRVITAIEDFWFGTLDEVRYCKHIYAMLYTAKQFGPEPSDYPVEEGSIVEWEAQLVKNTEKAQDKAAEKLFRYGMSSMDVPPYNLQSQMMFPMVQKLTNLPAAFITMSGFRMFDSNTGEIYNPSAGERPSVLPSYSGI